MTRVSVEPHTCLYCDLVGTFGVAPEGTAGLVKNQPVDARGIIHDPVYHERFCPLYHDWRNPQSRPEWE